MTLEQQSAQEESYPNEKQKMRNQIKSDNQPTNPHKEQQKKPQE